MNLIYYLNKQIAWSKATFGKGPRTSGIMDHIIKELGEVVEASYNNDKEEELKEWVDVIILALDAAWRLGYSPVQVCKALMEKQDINKARKWGKDKGDGKAIEHIRSKD